MRIDGSTGNDKPSARRLEGGRGDDRLYGRAGTDLLEGNAGRDNVNGGADGDVRFQGTASDQAEDAWERQYRGDDD